MRIITNNQEINQIILCKLSEPIHLFHTGYTFLLQLQDNAAVIYHEQHMVLKKNDIILLYPEESIELSGSAEAYTLLVTLDALFFHHCFSRSQNYLYFNSEASDNAANLTPHLVNMAMAHYTDAQNNYTYLMAQVYQVLHYINPRVPEKTNPDHMDKPQIKQKKKIEKIKSFIEENYTKQITLQELADYMSFTPQYLAGFMKEHLHITFYKYLNDVRLEVAMLFLKYTDEPFNKIAIDSGFPNPTTFLKQFVKKCSMEPLAFRTAFLNQKVQTQIPPQCQVNNLALIKGLLSERTLQRNTDLSIIESSVKESVCCNAQKSKSFSPSFRKLINLGDASNFENPGFREHLSCVQKEISFEYGRIQNIMSLIEHCIVTGYIEDSMANVYRMIDYLRVLHLKPLFDIGSKPAHIYMSDINENHQERLPISNYFEKVLNPLLSIFLKSCINHYGFHVVSEWQFEFWQEYDNHMTVIESSQSYLSRFKYVYKTIKELLPNAYVGGPGFNTYMDINNLKDTLCLMDKLQIKPDFISIYVYPYGNPYMDDSMTDSKQAALSPDKDIYSSRIKQCHQLIKEIWAQPPDLYVTEYGTHVLSKNYVNDALYPASLIIRESLNNYQHAQVMGYWLLSDFSLNFKYSPYILFGGNGIISKDGIKKPGFFAFKFLTLLGNRIIAEGEHYIITSSSKYNYQILIYYYSYFNEDYCRHLKKYELLKYPGSPFELLKPLTIEIILDNLEEGIYHINQWTLSHNHGNLLQEWKKINARAHLSNPEIAYLKNKSTPELNTGTRVVKDKLTLNTELAMHESVFYQINHLHSPGTEA